MQVWPPLTQFALFPLNRFCTPPIQNSTLGPPLTVDPRPSQVTLLRPLGMVLEECDEAGGACGLQVASLVPGGAAELSGAIEVDDRLVAVEGRDVRYGTFDGVMDLLVGKPNTEALLAFERAGAGAGAGVEVEVEVEGADEVGKMGETGETEGANEGTEAQPVAKVPEGGAVGAVGAGADATRTRVVDVGSSIGQGRRRTQEDALVVGTLSEEADDPLQRVLVAGVFDGHRTAEASTFAAERWIPTLRTSLAATVTHTLVAAGAMGSTDQSTDPSTDPPTDSTTDSTTDSSPPSSAFTRTGAAEALTVANAWRRLCDDYLESDKVGGATGEFYRQLENVS